MTAKDDHELGAYGKALVDIARALVLDLQDLASDLDGDADTRSSLTMLRRDLRTAVRAFLGFTVTLTVPGPAVSVALNVVDEALPVGTAADWVSIQLPTLRPGYTASILILAGKVNALDGLREDLTASLGIAPAALREAVGPQTVIVPGITGLEDFALANQATGVLMGAGHTQDTASVELIRLAHHHPGGMAGAARVLIEEAQQERPKSLA